jgi:hypothetical protein
VARGRWTGGVAAAVGVARSRGRSTSAGRGRAPAAGLAGCPGGGLAGGQSPRGLGVRGGADADVATRHSAHAGVRPPDRSGRAGLRLGRVPAARRRRGPRTGRGFPPLSIACRLGGWWESRRYLARPRVDLLEPGASHPRAFRRRAGAQGSALRECGPRRRGRSAAESSSPHHRFDHNRPKSRAPWTKASRTTASGRIS